MGRLRLLGALLLLVATASADSGPTCKNLRTFFDTTDFDCTGPAFKYLVSTNIMHAPKWGGASTAFSTVEGGVHTEATKLYLPASNGAPAGGDCTVADHSLIAVDYSVTKNHLHPTYQCVEGTWAQMGGLVGEHVVTTGTAPVVSACGSGPSPSVVGTDTAGKITVGGGVVTSCTLTFAVAYTTNAPACVIASNVALTSQTVATTTTAMTIGATALSADVISYHCIGVE